MICQDLNTALHQACVIGSNEVVQDLLKLKDKVTTQGVDNHEWNMIEAENLVCTVTSAPNNAI